MLSDVTCLGAPAAPSSEGLEAVLVSVGKDTLGVAQVGPEDNFFDPGRHSAGLARVQAQLQARLRREVSMVDLFRFPIVRSLAEQGRQQARSRRALPLRRRERQPGTAS